MKPVLGGGKAAGTCSAALRAGVAALLCLAGRLDAQAGAIFGIVTAKATGARLAYSIAGVDGDARTMFTTDSGRFLFRGVAPGRHTVRVRRLGFAPIELAVDIRDGVTDTLRFELEHVAVTLERIAVKAPPKCTAPGLKATMDTALASIVAQLMLNADQLRELSRNYPYEYGMEVRRVRVLRNDSLPISDTLELARYESKTRAQYRPGQMLQRENRRWIFRIAELQDLADVGFQNAHCWHYAGLDSIDGQQQYRVSFVAAASIAGVDANGTIWVDAASFQVRRTEMRFDRRPKDVPVVLDFVLTTDFREILPSIPIIEHVRSVQLMDPELEKFFAEVREDQHAFAFRFLGRKPGDPQ